MALDGESALKQAVANITAEGKALQSQMALVTSEFQNNANSQDALTAKGKVLSDQLATQKSKIEALAAGLKNAESNYAQSASAVESWKQKIADAKTELAKLEQSTGDTTKEEAKLRQEIQQMESALVKQEEKTGKAGKAVDEWKTKINYATVEENNLNAEIQKNEKYLDEAATSADGCAKSIDQYGDEVKEAADESEEFGEKSSGAVDSLASALAAAGIAEKLGEIKDALMECVDASIEFESVMAGVRRTVGGTDEELAEISDAFKEMSLVIPITTTEIGKIAETAGQLGIAQEDVTSFTEVMAMLATATDLTADNAATMLAQFSNVTGLDPENYDRLGSVVAQLGDATATTASKVVDMSQGMAASASIAGMAETDILGIAAAVGSLGIESQAGSTAMSTLIQMLYKAVETGSDKLTDFASVAGMTADEFATAWGNDAAGALATFIQGLNDTERNGSSAIVILDELGITNVRQTKAILGLSEAGDLLSNTLAQASQAWEENTALTEKAGIMYDTTESKMQLFENSVNLLKVAIGDVLTPALADMAGGLGDMAEKATAWVKDNPEMVKAITVAATSFGLLAAGVLGVVAAIKILKALELTTTLGKITLAISAVVAVGAGLISLFKSAEERATASTREMEAFRESLVETRQAFENWKIDFADKTENVDSLISTIVGLSDAEGRSAADTEILKVAIEELNAIAPELGVVFDEATGSINMTADALIAAAEAAKKQEEATATAERYLELQAEQKTAVENFRESVEALADAEAALQDAKDRNVDHSVLMTYIEGVNLAQEASDGYNAALCGVNREMRTTMDRLKELTGETADAADANDELADTIASITSELETLQKSYADAKTAAYNSISGQIGLWDEMDNSVVTSAGTLNGALLSQIEYLDTYSANMDSLLSRNIEGIEDFAKNFSDGSTESAAALAGLAAASDEEISDLITNLGKVEEGKKSFSDQIALLVTDFDGKMSDIEKRLATAVGNLEKTDEAALAGVNTIQAFVNAMSEKEGVVYQKALQIGQAAIDGLNAGIDAHSPSRKAHKSGVYVGEGVIGGLASMEAAIKAQGGKAGEAVLAGLRSSLESFDFSGTSWGATTALEKFKEAKAKLDHEKAMDLIDEANYYSQLLALRDQYLRDYDNLDTWRSTTQSIYSYQASLIKTSEETYKELVEMLDYYLALDLITQAQYYAKLTEYRDTYLDETTAAWRSATTAIYNYQKSTVKSADDIYSELLADLEHYYAMGLVSLEDYWARRQYLVDTYLTAESDQYRSAIEALQAAQEEYYADQVSTLDFYLALDLITEAEYYAKLEALRDTYLTENSDAWQSATEKLYKYQKTLLDTKLSEAEAAIDAWLATRKAQVSAELALEKERVNGIIAAINDEISARKQAKTEAGYEDAITAAQKKVDALLLQIEYERDEDNLAELQKELIRAQQSLAAAEENYSDYLWELEKNAEIAALQDEIAQLEADAAAELEALEAEAEAAKAEAQEEYLVLLNELVEYMRQLVAAAEATEESTQTGQVTQYDPTIDHTAMALAAETKEEFDYWAEKRMLKILGEGYGPSNYATTEQLYSQWLILHTDYDASTDYTAAALSATSEDDFWAAANARAAKIAGEGYDTSKYATTEQLYSQWLAAMTTATTAAETATLAAATVAETVYNTTSQTATVNVNNPTLSTGQIAAVIQEVLEQMAK